MTDEDPVVETAVERRRALAALAAGPRHRRDLEAELGVSKTTCHRIVRSFEERGLLGRTDAGYELTPLGEVVASETQRFVGTVRTAQRLEPLLDAVATAPLDLPVAAFADATITRPGPDGSATPVERFLALFRDAERIRSLDRASFAPPLYVEEMVESALAADADAVAVFPRSVVQRRFEKYPDLHRRVAAADAPLRYRVNDDVPFGLTVFDDDHVCLRAYDDDTGALVVLADTDDPEAVAWATAAFDHYHERSEPAATVEGLPDWVGDSDTPE